MSAPIPTERLFRAHASFVAAFLRRLGVRPADVDDAVQEVFLVAHEKGYRPGPATARTWLGAIAWRVASSRRRAASRREVPDDSGVRALRSPELGPAATVEARQRLALVSRALGTLDEEHRVPFILYELEGEACTSIAAGLGVPVGTVYSRLHNARQRFLAAYERLERGADDTGAEVGT